MEVFRFGTITARRERRRRNPPGAALPGPDVLEGRALTSVGPGAGPGPLSSFPATVSVPSPGAPVPTSSGGVRASMNVVYTTIGGHAEHLDLYTPTGPKPPGGRPVVLALPGGGWRWVRRNDLGVTVSELARYGYVVAVADYAFASPKPGTHVWPTNFEDVRQAVRWLKINAERYGIDPKKVAVWGESAGAHLGNLLGTDPDGPLIGLNGTPASQTPAGGVSARVQAVIDFYGPTDLPTLYTQAPQVQRFLDTFIGGPPSHYPAQYRDASPVSHVSADSPPFLIYQGTADTAVIPSQSAELDQTLTKAGVRHTIEYFPGLPHGFRLKVGDVNLLPQVLAFLDSALNHPGSKTP